LGWRSRAGKIDRAVVAAQVGSNPNADLVSVKWGM
jgi:hypothetical protein